METIYLITDTHRNAEQVARRLKLPQLGWRFISSPDDMMGLRGCHVIINASAEKRADWHILSLMIHSNEMEVQYDL